MCRLLALASLAIVASSSPAPSLAWTQLAANVPVPPSTLAPAGRSGAILFAAGGGGGVALAGGCSSSCCYAPLADLWVFDGGVWTNISQSGALPAPRLYHSSSAAAVNASAASVSTFVFGGTDVVTGVLNDLWLVTLTQAAGAWSAAWQQLSAGGPSPALPSPRTGQSQTALPAKEGGGVADGSFVIFGGVGEDAVVADAWLYTTSGGGGAGAFSSVAIAAGSGPGPRTQHAALILSLPLPSGGGHVSRVLVVSGGSDDTGDCHDDVWALSLDATTPAWLLLGSSASAGASPWPSVRHGHAIWAAAASPAGSAMERLGAVGGGPSQASSIAFTLFGGQNSSVADPANFLGDTWSFNVALAVTSDGGISLAAGTGVFTLINTGSNAPSPRALGGIVSDAAGSGAVYASGFGGYNGGTDDRLYNDVWHAVVSS